MTVTASESFKRGLRELARLPEPEFEELLAGLKAAPLEIGQNRILPDVKVASLPDGGELAKAAIMALMVSGGQRRASRPDVIGATIEALASDGSLDTMQIEALRRRAAAILGIESLGLVAKAQNVLVAHSHTYESARILSDIRAVFGNDVSAPPPAAVIVHMLNIIYNSAGRREIFTVAFDETDIDNLIGVLERARVKNKILKEIIEKSDLRYIGIA
jgi:hypothetical protein